MLHDRCAVRLHADLGRLGLLLACAALGFPLMAAAAQSSLAKEQEGKRMRALRIQEPIRVDGSLSEPVWQQAQPASDFLQREPVEGGAPTEATEVRVLYDDTYLYLGFRLFDSEPDSILATDRRRDSQMQGDDTIAVILDTFHDHRSGFLFQTNPLGTKLDILLRNEGGRQPRVGRGVGRGGPDHPARARFCGRSWSAGTAFRASAVPCAPRAPGPG